MKRIAIISLAIVLLLIPLLGVSCDSEGNGDNDISITTLPEGFTWYQNDEYGFKMAYPENWWEPSETQDEDGYWVTIRESFPPNPSMTDGKITVHITSAFDISRLEDNADSQEEVLINSREGHTYFGETNFSPIGVGDDDTVYTSKYSNTALEVNDKYYIITCYCLENVWDEKAPIFDTAIRSFTIE